MYLFGKRSSLEGKKFSLCFNVILKHLPSRRILRIANKCANREMSIYLICVGVYGVYFAGGSAHTQNRFPAIKKFFQKRRFGRMISPR